MKNKSASIAARLDQVLHRWVEPDLDCIDRSWLRLDATIMVRTVPAMHSGR